MPKRGKVDGSFSPSWSTVPYIHLVSITYFSGLCVVLVRQRIKGITHHHPPACIMLGLGGLFVLLGVDSLQLFTPGADGAWCNFGDNLLFYPTGERRDTSSSDEDAGERNM